MIKVPRRAVGAHWGGALKPQQAGLTIGIIVKGKLESGRLAQQVQPS